MRDTSKLGGFSSPSGFRANHETIDGASFSGSTQRNCLSSGKQWGSEPLRLRTQITIKTRRPTMRLPLFHISLCVSDLGWTCAAFCLGFAC